MISKRRSEQAVELLMSMPRGSAEVNFCTNSNPTVRSMCGADPPNEAQIATSLEHLAELLLKARRDQRRQFVRWIEEAYG